MRKILIIDDDGNWVQILRHFLTDAGYDVVSAMNSADGLKTATSELPDLIICDIFMPKGNGYEFAHLVKSNPVLRDIRLVAMTGGTLASTQTEAMSVGFDALIPKGINAAEFVAHVATILPPT